MKSTTEPHIDRPDEPILSGTDGYAPKRVRWPGLLAVAVLLTVAIAGVVVTDRDNGNRGNGSPDRNTQAKAPPQSPQAPPAEPLNTLQRDDTKAAPAAKPAQQ